MPIHLVLNRNARHLDGKGPLYDALRAAARGTCIPHETRTLAELDDAAATIAAAKPRAVILAGGDGAYMAGLSALAHAFGDAELPPIALAPGGTVSTVARGFGMGGSLSRYGERLVRDVVNGTAEERASKTLRLRDHDGRERTGFIFGTGLVVRFFDLYTASEEPGYAAAARIVGRVFASSLRGGGTARQVLTPLPATLVVEGTSERAPAYGLIVASVIPDLGLHMRVTYRAFDDDARVHLVASPLGPTKLGPQLPRVLLGRPLVGEGNVDRLVTSFEVTFTGVRRAYVLDGDSFETDSVRVTVGPRVRILTPR